MKITQHKSQNFSIMLKEEIKKQKLHERLSTEIDSKTK